MLALVFELGAERYAVPARKVHEVVRRPVTRAVAGAPEWIEGLFAWGAGWVPLIDLSRLVTGQPCPAGASSRVAIVDHERAAGHARRVGLLAPGMTRVLDLGDAPQAAGLHVPGQEFLGQIALHDRYGVQLVDVDKLLPATLDPLLFHDAGAP